MSKKFVLVVEDHKKQNEKLCNIVRESGYEPLSAYNGIEAFQQLKKYRRGFGLMTNKIQCILLDWNMPQMRGEEFLGILRKQEKWKFFSVYIPVVIVTAYDDREKREFAADRYSGLAAGYITKPYDAREIQDTLSRIIEDRDNASLIELNRTHYFSNDMQLADRIQRESEEKERMKMAFYRGDISVQSLAYLDKKRLKAQIEFERAQLEGKLDKATMNDLETIASLYQRLFDGLKDRLSSNG